MRLSKIWIVAVVLLAFAACNGSRETITGSYGQSALSGQVVLTGGSPAGVRVSVRGTGMTSTLGDDGQFFFAGVPEDATLDFVRESDGIEASMKSDAKSGFVLVDLTKTTAQRSSRRRAAGPTRDKVTEFEGLVRSAAADSIVVYTSHKEEVTIGLDANTVIRNPTDLVVGARVHVKAKKVGDAWLAVSVIVQNSGDDDGGDDDPPATVREYEGLVRSASATELVVFTSHKEEVTFTITADTIVRKGNTPIAPETIAVGTRVHVKATANADGTNTATRVTVQNTH
jgi:hypothetical protein